jgi:hypothetical protein
MQFGATLRKYHIEAKSSWEPFFIDQSEYGLGHLTGHKVTYTGNKESFVFIVTYSLHCFTKDDDTYSVTSTYSDGKETRQINLERYEASKKLRGFVENFDKNNQKFYETATEKFFTIEMLNSFNNVVEPYKICFCTFKENRLLRLHITSAFFDRTSRTYNQKQYSIFKIAMDARKRPKDRILPIEARKKF